jgi:hypothetical protein
MRISEINETQFFERGENHGYEPQGKPMDPNSAAEQRSIIPSACGGIVRLTNFLSLRSKNLSLTNKLLVEFLPAASRDPESGAIRDSEDFVTHNEIFNESFHAKYFYHAGHLLLLLIITFVNKLTFVNIIN